MTTSNSSDPLEHECPNGTPHSIVSSVPSSIRGNPRDASNYKTINTAEACFITKKPGLNLEKFHWVNAVRRNPKFKLRVDFLLRKLGIVDIYFDLNGAANLAPLNRTLHYTLDKLGFFAVTCSKKTLLSLIDLIEEQNQAWEEEKRQRTEYTRKFKWNQPPFADATYELVVLYPRHFLPKNGNALTVFTENRDELLGKMYFVSPDGALREGPDDKKPRLPVFASDMNRTPFYAVNPFLVAINAEIAFSRHKRVSSNPYPVCADYLELMDLTIELVDKIYYQPLVNHIEDMCQRYIVGPDSDVAMGRLDVDARKTRFGKVVQQPGRGASREETLDYYRYMMSGCDYDEGEEDEDEDDVEGGRDLARLGISSQFDR